MMRTWLPRRISVAFPAPRALACVAACVGAAALAACSSPPSRFYTLNADAAPASASTSSAPRGAQPLLIEVPPIDVPSQVAKTSFVVQTGPNQVNVLEQTRWASLPSDEIRRALSVDLTQRLDAIDVSGTAYPNGVPLYRVSLNVQRFESWPGSHALIDAVWSVRAVRTQTVLTCRSVVSEPVKSGYDALVDGHRRAVRDIATQIAAGIDALAAAPQVPGTGAAAAAKAKNASAAAAAPARPVVPCPPAVANGGAANASSGG